MRKDKRAKIKDVKSLIFDPSSLIYLRKFFDILEEVKKEEQTTIETLFEGLKDEGTKNKDERPRSVVLDPCSLILVL